MNQSGILNGVRFIPWGKINSFQFIPIDSHHRLYGFVEDVNDGYELRLKGRTTVISCFVTNKEVKENLERILEQKVKKTLIAARCKIHGGCATSKKLHTK